MYNKIVKPSYLAVLYFAELQNGETYANTPEGRAAAYNNLRKRKIDHEAWNRAVERCRRCVNEELDASLK